MKMRLILSSLLAVCMLAACSKNDTDPPAKETADVAYLSIRIEKATATRASGEEAGVKESDIKTLFLVTFDDNGNIVGVPGASSYYTKITGASTKPGASKVSAAATRLLVIVNPGRKLEASITGLNATSTYTSLNAAITDAMVGEITDDVDAITKGFAMINSGDETGKNVNERITDPLVNISGKIKKVSDYASEEEAIAEAEDERVKIKVERLASKLELKVKSQLEVKPSGAKFTFGNWTLDAVNTTFYPYAVKTMLEVDHDPGSYTKNFYTEDPNFTGAAGLDFSTIDTDTYDPVLPVPYTWMQGDQTVYGIENTMAAAEQKFGNATRLVIKGIYHPESDWTGDWFNFAGVNYRTLQDLKEAYADTEATNLRAACDKMYAKISAYAATNTINLEGNNFATLTEGDLGMMPNGGELIKDGKNDVIRWYQGGLSYYYYEIRHDDVTTQEMAFGKYGVVRNNWYSMNLAKVNGAGTPWYPDINNPGPGDPDPTDPIDESAGYLGVEILVEPWIMWDRDIEI